VCRCFATGSTTGSATGSAAGSTTGSTTAVVPHKGLPDVVPPKTHGVDRCGRHQGRRNPPVQPPDALRPEGLAQRAKHPGFVRAVRARLHPHLYQVEGVADQDGRDPSHPARQEALDGRSEGRRG